MKKILALLALVLGVVSCQTEPEGLDVNVGGEQDVTICVNIPETETRTGGNNSALGVFDNGILSDANTTMRYILQVFQGIEQQNGDITWKASKETKFKYSDGKSVTFDVRLVPNRDYKFVVWADVVTNGERDTDNHYNTHNGVDGATDLTKITIIDDNTHKWVAMDESRDAFTGVELIEEYTSQSTINVELKRPFAKLRVKTTDVQALKNLDISPAKATVSYSSTHYTTFDALNGSVSGQLSDKSHTMFDIAEYRSINGELEEGILFTDYFFAAEQQESVQFQLYVYEDEIHGSELIKYNNFSTEIAVRRNYLTTIQGNILTDGNNVKVTVEDAFENKDNLTDEPYFVEIWDGESISQPAPAVDENGTVIADRFIIENPSELAWLAAAVSGTLPTDTRGNIPADSFAGKTFVLTEDINLGDNEWTPIGVGGNHFEGTFDGQGHTIKGLQVTERHNANQAGLFCSLAGNATIKNVIIDEAYVKYPGVDDFYGSAIVGTVYGNVTFENITVKNSTITGNNKVGAIFAHDGSSTKITINNCHVHNCYIASDNTEDGGNVGGLIGLFQTGSDKESTISNSSVKKCTIVGINSTNSGKRANSEFIGGILSKANTNLTISDCVVENNNFSQTIDGTNPVTYVGSYDPQFIGGDRNERHLGKVVINGNDAIYVDSAEELQDAVDNAVAGTNNITFAADIEGEVGEVVVVIQQPDVKITIDGAGKKFNGYFKVHSNSEHYTTAAVTFKYINFETSTASVNFIEALENGSERYSTNITAENCTFTATGEAVNTAVGLQIKSSKNAKVINCTATNLHSLLQANSCDEKVEVIGCTINGKGGVSFTQVKAATVEGTTIIAAGYGIRYDGRCDNYGIVVKNNNITAAQPFIVRKMTGANNTITLEGTNTLSTEAEYQIVITNGSDNETYVKPTGTYTLTGADGYTMFPVLPCAKVGNTEYTNIDEAIAAWTNGSTLTLLKNVTLTDVITLKSTEHHILDLGTYTMTAASGKNAIEITCNGRSSASYALTVNADATNPGGITATGKACIYYKKSDSTKDRPIILINNGVFTGSYSINSTSNGNTNCPQIWINGGVFNSYMNLTKNMLKVSGGTFHAAINCTGDSSAYRQISGGRFKSWQFMTADASNKFWVGTAKATYDVGVYVDDEGYLVVGGPVITEFGDKFAAKATNPTKWSPYLQYSSAAANGLYYTNAEMAIKKHGEANVVLK